MIDNDVQIYIDSNNIIHVRMIGFWNTETLNRYASERSIAIKKLLNKGLRPDQIGIILDADDFKILSKEIAEGLSNLPSKEHDKDIHVAVVLQHTLQQLQAKRMAPERYHFFDSQEDAVAWVKEVCADKS